MKTKQKILGLFLMGIFITSCDKDDVNELTISSDETIVNARLDNMNDDVTYIINSQLNPEDGINGKYSSNAVNNFLPQCATVTRVPDYGTIITPGTTITKTIDFGTTGCALLNGNILKGAIIISFVYQPQATSHIINYEFLNFYHNLVKIEGNKTFTRSMTTGTVSNPSHPIITMNMDLVATFPNGNIHNRTGSRTSEIIEGYGNLDLLDNVYSVSGSWVTTYPNASPITSTITSPLIVRFNCNHITQGIITLTRNNNNATLDYGNGLCDNQAIFTINGNSFQIILGN